MILASKVDSVHVHTTIVCPIVGEGNDELDSDLGGGVNNLVEALNIDSRLAIVPSLKDDLGSRTLAAVLRKTVRVVGGVLVVEAPGSEDLQAGIFGRRQTLDDIGLSLLNIFSTSLRPGKGVNARQRRGSSKHCFPQSRSPCHRAGTCHP